MIEVPMKLLIDYYQAILKTNTEEEVLELKESLQEELQQLGYSNESIEIFTENVSQMVEEGYVLNELENFIFYGDLMDYNKDVESVQEVHSINYTQPLASGAVGVGLTTLIIAMALKKKFLKNNKQIKR